MLLLMVMMDIHFFLKNEKLLFAAIKKKMLIFVLKELRAFEFMCLVFCLNSIQVFFYLFK